jgi:hypothetical protein
MDKIGGVLLIKLWSIRMAHLSTHSLLIIAVPLVMTHLPPVSGNVIIFKDVWDLVAIA